jgi:hypothetical protein
MAAKATSLDLGTPLGFVILHFLSVLGVPCAKTCSKGGPKAAR